MVDPSLSTEPAPLITANVQQAVGIEKLLRKLRGQYNRPIEFDSKNAYATSSAVSGSDSGADDNFTASDSKQIQSEVYADGGRARFYEPIATYEGRHRWDPLASWSESEEKKLVRRLDFKICSWVCFMFFALQLDRGNIVQALADNMLVDLGLNTNDYNYGMMAFYSAFLFAELPSQLISKKIGPDNWIPIQMVLWSVVACSQSHLNGKASFYVTRILLGLIEGGFIPDVILYLSYFYKSKELPIRLSFFWSAYISTSIIGAFLAYGILHLGPITGWAGWRWLFALEGALTASIGIVSFFYLPPSPTESASYFRGKKGWFSEREEIIMVNRILRDDPGKGDMHNRQGISWKLLKGALTDYDLWPIYVLGITWQIPQSPTAAYITLSLKHLGWTTFQVSLLTVPAYVLFLIQLIFWTWISEKINNRFLIVLMCQIWMLPLLVSLEVLPANANSWIRYALSVLMVGFPYIHAILVGLTSRNAGSVRTRTVGTALYNMAVQGGTVISSNIYRDDDKPLYRRGNKVLLAILAFNVVWICICKAYYIYRNEQNTKKWGAMSQEQKDEYLATTTDEGNKRLDFRFAH